MSLLAHHHARRAAQPSAPLVQQFLHDSRQDVIRYTGAWAVIPTGGGSPYRNEDVALLNVYTPTSSESLLDFAFTSGGRDDEWLSAHAAIDSTTHCQVWLNGQLVLERFTSAYSQASAAVLTFNGGSSFYTRSGDFYESPWFILRPAYGLNHLQLIKFPPADAGFYFDGFGLNLRGGPVPL